MGLNICVYCGDGYREHPDWDSSRLAGDRDFPDLLTSLPFERKTFGDPHDGEYHYRPSDFDAWRKEIASREWPNAGRFEHLMDLLENNPDCWIYFSF